MFKSKIVAMMVLVIFAMGIFLVNSAVAGEYVRARNITHTIKWQQIDVGDVDGHVVAVSEAKGVTSNKEGKWFAEGWAYREWSLYDINLKTGLGSGHGYGDITDRDGNKCYFSWEGKAFTGGKFGTGYWEGTWKYIKGTGKFVGIKGGGPFLGNTVGDEICNDWEGEFELPR